MVETADEIAQRRQRIASKFSITVEAAKQVELIRAKFEDDLKLDEAVDVVRHRHPERFQYPLTVAEALERYEADTKAQGLYLKNGRSTQRELIHKDVTGFTADHGGEPATKMGAAMLRTHRKNLIATTKLTRNGINRKIGLLRQACAWLHEEEILTAAQIVEIQALAPIERGKLPSRDQKQERRAVPFEDIEKAATVAGRVVGSMVRLQAMVGCRLQDITGMKWCEIDRTPVMVDGVACWTWRPSGHKTELLGHEVVYGLPSSAQKILEYLGPCLPTVCLFSPQRAMQHRHDDLRRKRKSEETKRTRERDRRSERRAFGSRYSTADYRQALERACKKAKVDRFTPHEIGTASSRGRPRSSTSRPPVLRQTTLTRP